MNRPILLIGAGGFIGRRLARSLTSRGDKVVSVLSSIDANDSYSVEPVPAPCNPEEFFPLLSRVGAVVFLASKSTPSSTACVPLEELNGNLKPVLLLLQALHSFPEIPLIYLSSGGSLYRPNALSGVDETAPIAPRSYHGAAKAAAEHFIAAWCAQSGGSATVIRPSNVYGPGQAERNGFAIVPTAFGKIRRGEPLTVWGDGTTVRDYLFVDDLVALCMSVLAAPTRPGVDTLNAGSGTGTSLQQLLDLVEEVAGKPLQRTFAAARSVDAPYMVIDSHKALEQHDWQPATPLKEGLHRTWIWLTTTRH